MGQNIIIELINTLSSLLIELELFFINFSPGFNYMMMVFFIVSVISLMFWIVAKNIHFVGVGTK